MRTTFCDGLRRRDFLRVGVMGGTGVGLSQFLRLLDASEQAGGANRGKPPADSVLFINLAGGPSHLDSLDMKPEAPVDTQGEFQRIASAMPGLQVCEHLPKLAARINDFALIRGISHTSGSHPLGQSYISTGNRPTPALIHPSYGSVVSKEYSGDSELPPYVAIPVTEWNAGYLGDAYAPFKTNAVPQPGQPFEVRGITLPEGLTVDQVNRRERLLQKIDNRFREIESDSQLLEALESFGGQAHQMIVSPTARNAFDVSLEQESIRKLFGDDEFNQSLLLASRLIESGVRFVTVTFAGWDTHLKNFEGHRRLLPQLDQGLDALMSTLISKGLLERTLVVAMGEFGRTPKINENAGRDHYPRVNWCLMSGGGVQPGQLIGGTDKAGANPDDDTEIHPDDIAASLYTALGIDPRGEYYTATGRPVMIVPEGRVIPGLTGT